MGFALLWDRNADMINFIVQGLPYPEGLYDLHEHL